MFRVLVSDKIFESIVTTSPMAKGFFELSFKTVCDMTDEKPIVINKILRKRCFIYGINLDACIRTE